MRHPRRGPVPALLALAAAMCLLSLGAANGTDATGFLVRRPGSTFQPEPPPPGMISRQRAIRLGLRFAVGRTASASAGVHAAAYFGIYTDTLYTRAPVWIVRVWGPGITIEPSGPMPPPGTPYCARRAAHEELVVLNGRTGRYMEGDVGIQPQGLPTLVATAGPVPAPCPTRPAHAISPTTIGVGARGNLFVGGAGDMFSSQIQKRSPTGRFLFAFPDRQPGDRDHPIIHLALDGAGDVFAGTDDNLVQKFSPAGRLLWTWAPHGTNPDGQTMGWWSVAAAPNGITYAASRYRGPIYVLSPGGRVAGTRPGRWTSLAVTPAGTLYAGDVGRGLIQAFAPDGRRLSRWYIERTPGVGAILALAAGWDGSVDVLEERKRLTPTRYEIVHYAATGQILGRITLTEGTGSAQVLAPRDLAVGPRGTMFLADIGNPMILVYSPGGRLLARWRL